MTRNLGVRFVAGNHGPQLRDQVRQIDAALPIYQVDRFTNIVQRQTSHERLSTVLLTSFALLAIALVVGGIYAVIALEVARRRRDLGVRLALGASPAQLRALVLRTTFRPAVLGIALGAVATLLLTRYLETLLFGIQPNDPATITGAALLLLLVALAAAYVPARRAGRLDPIAALKENP